ncbi:MAG TPA: hypothetical protein ENK85_12735, partial [Saprospiraceae bacterium]|nr:hypothetical protein [Saprospiraceae bacterium]
MKFLKKKSTYFGLFIWLMAMVSMPFKCHSQSNEYNKAFAQANLFIKSNTRLFYSLATQQPTEIAQSNQVVALLYPLFPKGFIIISPSDEKTIMGYSFENNFNTSDEYQLDIMAGMLRQINEGVKNKNLQAHPREIQEINIPPLVHSLFGQVNCVDDNDVSVLVTNLYTPNHYAPGCVAISAATLLHYYQWPTRGMGQHVYSDAYGASKGTYSANFGDTEYDWANIKERYKYKATTETEREAIGTLVYQNCVALDMDFEYNGSTSNVNRIPNTGKDYFRFNGKYASATSPIFWKVVDTNIVHQMPVIFAISASNGAGHSIVCDGLNIDSTGQETHHLNMGWWGTSNGWYKIKDGFSVAGYNKIDGGVINFLPTPMSLPPALSADHTQLTFNWQVSQTILPDAYELQIRKDAGDWETIADTITQTAYTMDIDTTVQMYYARVRSKINNKWASESWSNTVVFNMEVLPVLETSKSNIHIFPNPFSEKLKIDLHQPADIKVYNQNGQTMLQQALTGKNELS